MVKKFYLRTLKVVSMLKKGKDSTLIERQTDRFHATQAPLCKRGQEAYI